MKTIFLIFMGAALAVILILFMSKCSTEKRLNKIIAVKEAAIQACLNAPVKVDTVITTKVLTDTIYLKYTYRVTDTVHESEAIDWIEQTIEQRDYSGTYEDPQFFVNWTAKVTGTLDELTINPPSLVRGLEITKTKTVDLTQYQTPQSTIKEKGHIYTSMGVSTNFKAINAVDLNLMWITRKGFGLITGVQTDFDQANFRAGLVVRLK